MSSALKLLGIVGCAVVLGAMSALIDGWGWGLFTGITTLGVGIGLLRTGRLRNRPPVA